MSICELGGLSWHGGFLMARAEGRMSLASWWCGFSGLLAHHL